MTDDQKRDILLIVTTILFISFVLGAGNQDGGAAGTAQEPIVIA